MPVRHNNGSSPFPREDLAKVLADIRDTSLEIVKAVDAVADASTADERIVALGVLHHHVSAVRADKAPKRVFVQMGAEKPRALATYRDIVKEIVASGGSLSESRLRQAVGELSGGPARRSGRGAS